MADLIVTGDKLFVRKLAAGQFLALYSAFPADSNTVNRITNLNSGDYVGTYIQDQRRALDGSVYYYVQLAVPVRDSRGTTHTRAWVYSGYVYEPPVGKKYYAYNPGGAVNVRSGPGTSYKVVRTAKHGEYVGVSYGREQNGFLQLITDAGAVVWMGKSYVQAEAPTAGPVVKQPTGTVGNPETGTHPNTGPQQQPAEQVGDQAERVVVWYQQLDKTTLYLGVGIVVALVVGMIFAGRSRKRSRR